jgi:mannose-6-phosphate isomerase-like protein (cupin superfamily)
MKIVRPDDARHSEQTHRAGRLDVRQLLQGDPASPNNFEWSFVRMGEDYATPRHRHNFSQIIYVLNGTLELSPVARVEAGSCTYTGEGTYYGPQRGRGSRQLTLQFGDASGSGFLSYDGVAEGTRRLAPLGTFANGVFTRHDAAGGRRNQDSYEAIWEEMNGRRIAYPTPRYDAPIIMHPAAYAWVPVDGLPGIATKHLGSFNERGTALRLFCYADGAARRVQDLAAPELHFVLSGTLQCSRGPCGAHTVFMIEPGDDETLSAAGPVEELVVRLPDLRFAAAGFMGEQRVAAVP